MRTPVSVTKRMSTVASSAKGLKRASTGRCPGACCPLGSVHCGDDDGGARTGVDPVGPVIWRSTLTSPPRTSTCAATQSPGRIERAATRDLATGRHLDRSGRRAVVVGVDGDLPRRRPRRRRWPRRGQLGGAVLAPRRTRRRRRTRTTAAARPSVGCRLRATASVAGDLEASGAGTPGSSRSASMIRRADEQRREHHRTGHRRGVSRRRRRARWREAASAIRPCPSAPADAAGAGARRRTRPATARSGRRAGGAG